MPYGKGTYGSKVGRPKKKKTAVGRLAKGAAAAKAGKRVAKKAMKARRAKSVLTAKQRKLPPALQKKIMVDKCFLKTYCEEISFCYIDTLMNEVNVLVSISEIYKDIKYYLIEIDYKE